MSRKTVSQGSVAVALVAFLTVASAAPTLAATRSSGPRGVQAPTTVWGLVLDLAGHFSRWLAIHGLQQKAVPTAQESADIGMGADPNGIELSAGPTDPAPFIPGSGR